MRYLLLFGFPSALPGRCRRQLRLLLPRRLCRRAPGAARTWSWGTGSRAFSPARCRSCIAISSTPLSASSAAHPSRGLRPGNRRRATPHVQCAVALLRDRSRIPPELGENRAAATKRSKPWRGGQPLLCPTSKRLLVTPHSFALEIEMLYERRLAVIFRSSVASIKLRFSSRE
jgi:hypothetical protein